MHLNCSLVSKVYERKTFYHLEDLKIFFRIYSMPMSLVQFGFK